MSATFYSMVEIGDRLADLANEISLWSQATFGSDAERGPIGPLKHLAKEAQETIEAYKAALPISANDISDRWFKMRDEFADCLILMLDSSRRAGIKTLELIKAAQAKMEVNKRRSWPKPTSDEPVEHVRTEEELADRRPVETDTDTANWKAVVEKYAADARRLQGEVDELQRENNRISKLMAGDPKEVELHMEELNAT